jgi:hypothetical protein
MDIQAKYEELCKTPSDINEHLPTLKRYAEECEHVTEMGVRHIVSTYALLMGKPKVLISYDIMPCNWRPLAEAVKDDTHFEFKLADTLDVTIDETDLLFIDTLHNYDQLTKELALHGNKARKHLIFHDTTSYEWIGESYRGRKERGIWPAINEFLKANPHWSIKERYKNNNGLTILERA